MSYQELFNQLAKIDKCALEEESNNKYAFNIFSILRKKNEEVGLHSKFLAEMLNSNASHKMPDFQFLFIKEVINAAINSQEWRREPIAIDPKVKYTCEVERNFQGFGKADIVLESSPKTNIIVIENKINAADQKAQLQRYFEACQSMGYAEKNIYVLYLNKYGTQVTKHGKGNLSESQFGQINYKDDISNWLDRCLELVKAYPHIEQTILQYRRLIGSLTGDNRSAKMKEQHIELLYQDNSFKLAYELSQSFDSFQINLQKKIWQGLFTLLEQRGYDFQFCDKDLKSCDENRKIKNYYKNGSKKNRLYGIQYEVGSLKGYKAHCFIQLNDNIYYGITLFDGEKRIQYPDSLDSVAKEIKRICPGGIDGKTKFFVGGHRLPSSPVRFKKPNSSLYQITEESSRKKWLKDTVDEVITLMEKVRTLDEMQD